MNQKIIKVPYGIKYIMNWEGYSYPLGHCIVDKGVTGCGYTEYCLRNDKNLILCSPRKILLENKEEKHLKEGNFNVCYLKNEIDDFTDISLLYNKISEHIVKCQISNKPTKFMITYDSAHYLLDYLEEHRLLDQFYLVADEFQSIFLDSYFKVNIENSFLETIQRCKNIIYLSATPMLSKYLNMLDEFKDLDYYYIDWADSGYVENIVIQDKRVRSLLEEANKIVKAYLQGDFPTIIDNSGKITQSREAVFYFNSVTEIIRIISKNKLKPDEVNIICSNTEENQKKLKKIKHSIGRVPLELETNKMFTFCTSTVYIGADFYSTNASTYIFADPNLKWLALDISIDLPQIAGRQRNRNNPFKNNITIFYKTLNDNNKFDKKEFDIIQEERRATTSRVINIWEKCNKEERKALAYKIKSDIIVNNYSNDYSCISEKTGQVVFNRLIEIANERAWEVSQDDYKDSISVTRAIESLDNFNSYRNNNNSRTNQIVEDFLHEFYDIAKYFNVRLKLFCEFMDQFAKDPVIYQIIKHRIPDLRYHNYYNYFGTACCKALKFQDGNLKNRLLNEINNKKISNFIFEKFKESERYSNKEVKSQLLRIYDELGLNKKAKATDIEEWFETKKVQIYNPETKEKVNGVELIRKK